MYFKTFTFALSMFMQRSIKIPVCFLVLSFFWLVTASLLSFHMHRIFQQDLIPQTILCKRFKEQIEKNDTGKTLVSTHFSLTPGLPIPIDSHGCFFQAKLFVLSKQSAVLQTLASLNWPKRRGPPVSF